MRRAAEHVVLEVIKQPQANGRTFEKLASEICDALRAHGYLNEHFVFPLRTMGKTSYEGDRL